MLYIYSGNDHITAITNHINADSHKHITMQISISFRNAFEITIADQAMLSKGILLDSNVDHKFSSHNDTQMFLLIDNSSSIAKQLQDRFLNHHPYYLFDDSTISMLQELLQQFHPMLKEEYYQEFYSELLQKLGLNAHIPITMDPRIIKVLKQINACVKDEHRIDDFAKSVFLSTSRLSHLFKAETGMRLSAYMVMHKLQKAMYHVFSGKTMTDSALLAGFDSPSHFASVCKKILGLPARNINQDSVFLKVLEF